MVKILFLDFDGVLIPLKKNSKRVSYFKKPAYLLNKDAIEKLNTIVEKTDCRVVVSSDWKLYWGVSELNSILQQNGFKYIVTDVTKDLNISESKEGLRAAEIKDYIKTHNIINYCILDDLNLKPYFDTNFVYCEDGARKGLNQKGLKENAILFLNKK